MLVAVGKEVVDEVVVEVVELVDVLLVVLVDVDEAVVPSQSESSNPNRRHTPTGFFAAIFWMSCTRYSSVARTAALYASSCSS